MKRTLLSTALVAALGFSAGTAQGTSFTYHGSLQDSGKPADGSYDIELTLYSASSGGSVIGGPLIMHKVPVHGGSFSTEADFGPLAKSFSQAYIEVKVRTAGQGEFSSLDTRAQVTPNTSSVCPGAWTLQGNAGNPAGSYLGTADTQPLTFEVNGAQVGKIIVSGNANFPSAPNIVFGSPTNSAASTVGGATIAGGGDMTKTGCGLIGSSPCVNSAQADFATVGGGFYNTAGIAAGIGFDVVAGGNSNTADGGYSSVGGGDYSIASGQEATVAGGGHNIARASSATVGGGSTNTANGVESTVAGGSANIAGAGDATVGGGTGNTASGVSATVGGGESNMANKNYSTVAGGGTNTASGYGATVPGGLLNFAGGDHSFAGGYNASVRDPVQAGNSGSCASGINCGDYGAFVWNGTAGGPFTSTGPNQFLIQATGGVGINTNNPNGVSLRIGTTTSDGDGAYLSNGGVWMSGSSRTFKEDFAEVDVGTVLAKVIELPVPTWFYKNDHQEGRHIGPVAEDFSALFGLGNDDKHIGGVDESGVAFAAIQGLNRKVEEENGKLKQENSDLRNKLEDVLERLSKLEAKQGE